jgi:hypothetical protein
MALSWLVVGALAATEAEVAAAACSDCDAVMVLAVEDASAASRWVVGTVPASTDAAACATASWRVVEATPAGLRAGEPFFTEAWGDACDYGPSGYGVDVELDGAQFRFTVDRGGPVSEARTWVWRIGATAELVSRDVALLDRNGSRSADTRDLASGRVTHARTLPICGRDVEEMSQAAWLHLPALSARALERSWKEEGPASMAASVSDAADGYLLSGARGVAADAGVAAALVDGRTLLIDVMDDTIVRAPVGDAVVVYFGPVPRPSDNCVRVLSTPVSLRIPLSMQRGRVGLARMDGVEVHGGVRVRLRLSVDVDGVTVVYEDVDEAGVVERVIATSQLDPQDAATLGRVGGVRDL